MSFPWTARPATPSTYRPITPVRVLDTRSVTYHPGKLLANTPRTFQITGRQGIPAGVSAVTGNVTVVGSSAGWALYVGPTEIAKPKSSMINFTARQVTANGVTVALSASGSLSATYISSAGATTDLVFDVTGYFTPDVSGDTYHPMDPVRELDTRYGNGLSGKLTANTPAASALPGASGVPASAKAVSGNVTVVGSSRVLGCLCRAHLDECAFDIAVNFRAGEVKGNNLTVALEAPGTLWATYMGPAGATTDLVFDVTGYYTADSTGCALRAHQPGPSARYPSRHGPTRASSRPIPHGPSPWPARAESRPTRTPSPATSPSSTRPRAGRSSSDRHRISKPATHHQLRPGDVKANGLTVAVSASGTLSATYLGPGGATTDLVFDVTGYFVR